MAYVPGLANDIFLSYAHGDGDWAGALQVKLCQELAQCLGAVPAIWVDARQLGGEQPIRQEIEEQLSRSALLITVVSPLYLRSHFCRLERQRFSEAALESGGLCIGNRLRIFKFVKTPEPGNGHKQIVPETAGFEFFDPESLQSFPIGSSQFESVFGKAVRRMRDLLNIMRNRRQAVYVADTAYDLVGVRTALRDELEAHGHRVVPEILLDPAEAEASVPERLDESVLSVHLFGPSFDAFAARQIQIALDMGTPVVAWATRGSLATSDARQLALFERISKHLESTGVSELKSIVHDRLKPRRVVDGRPFRDMRPNVYLLCVRDDQRQRAWDLRDETRPT